MVAILLNELIIGLSIGTLVLVFASILMILKLKRFESENVFSTINLVLAGLVLYMALLVIDALNYIDIFTGLGGILGYLPALNSISGIFIMPLITVCFMAAIFILRDS